MLNFCNIGIEADDHKNSFSGKKTMLDHGMVALSNHGTDLQSNRLKYRCTGHG